MGEILPLYNSDRPVALHYTKLAFNDFVKEDLRQRSHTSLSHRDVNILAKVANSLHRANNGSGS